MSKYAFYPGCVARGGAPELYDSTMAVADKLGLGRCASQDHCR